MRKSQLFLLPAFLAFFFSGKAQDYRVIVPRQPQYFKVTSQSSAIQPPNNIATWSEIKVLFFDSSTTNLSGSENFTFHTWRDTVVLPGPPLACVIENGPAWSGSEVTELTSGMNYFFNFQNDTIRVRSDATVNQSWSLMDLDSGKYIFATVDSLVLLQVAGMQDSVKFISLSVFDSTGTPLSNHPVNGQIICLSKTNGLFKTLSFREFPANIVSLIRIPVIPMPDNLQMYDYNAGDEFEYTGYCYDILMGSIYGPVIYTKILSRSFSPNGDTVIYHRLVVTRTLQHSSTPPYQPDTLINSHVDSVFYTNLHQPFYPAFPEQNNYSANHSEFLNYLLSMDSSQYNNHPGYSETSGYSYRGPTDSCYLFNYFEPTSSTNEYVAGLGLVNSESYQISVGGPNCYNYLIWYHKGSETWGNYTDLLAGIKELSLEKSLHLFPNPAHNQCKLRFDRPFKGLLNFTDVTGRLLFTIPLNDLDYDLDLSDLSPGIYVLSLINDSEILNRKIIKN